MSPTTSRTVPCPWLMFSKASWIIAVKDGFKYTAVSPVRLKCCPLQGYYEDLAALRTYGVHWKEGWAYRPVPAVPLTHSDLWALVSTSIN